MQKIQSMSRILSLVLSILAVVLFFTPILGYFLTESAIGESYLGLLGSAWTPEGFIDLKTFRWTSLSKFIFYLAQSVSIAPYLFGVLILKNLFRNYQIGEVFVSKNARFYSALGGLFLIDAFALQPLSSLLKVYALTLDNLPGHRYITLSFANRNVEAIFCGVIILLIAKVMLEASRLYEEQQLTI